MNETTFENARVGDMVWDAAYGTMTICQKMTDNLVAKTGDGEAFNFNVKGHMFIGRDMRDIDLYAPNRTLFWSEIQITPPPRPKRKEKVEIVRYFNIYRSHDATDRYFHCSYFDAWSAKESSVRRTERLVAIAVPVTIAFEVEE